MSRLISRVIAYGSYLCVLIGVLAALYALIDLDWFKQATQSAVNLRIQWQTVESWQWYSLWAVTVLFLSLGLLGLFYLGRAFMKISHGEWFNQANSLNLRRFSLLLLLQVIAQPIHFAIASVILSLNHPEGEHILAIYFGSQQVATLGLALVLWVLSDLLVLANQYETENKQFV